MWWLVWLVLVAATLVGAYLLGRRLWRTWIATTAALGRASALGERLGSAADRPLPPPPAWVHPLLRDEADRARLRAGLRERRASRARRRAVAQEAAVRRWWAWT